MQTVLNHTPDTLRALFSDWREPPYRVAQLLEWIYRHGATSYEQMSNLPALLRERLTRELPLYTSTLARSQKSEDGTTKLLLRWPDGTMTECVLIPDRHRFTACLSSQVGCPAACVFCASGIDGLIRQLKAGEIVEQLMRLTQLGGLSERVTNVVMMGSGEPLANYAATVQAVRTINAAWGAGIGARRITISTVGLPSQMRRLADEGIQLTLALSLHAPNDQLRRRLIPWSENVSIASLIDAARYYFDRSGREVTLEYILLGGVNDDVACAHELADVAAGCRANVNLLTYNRVDGLPYERSSPIATKRMLATLRSRGINTHLRRSRGRDIDAACGQLRRRAEQAEIRPVALGRA